MQEKKADRTSASPIPPEGAARIADGAASRWWFPEGQIAGAPAHRGPSRVLTRSKAFTALRMPQELLREPQIAGSTGYLCNGVCQFRNQLRGSFRERARLQKSVPGFDRSIVRVGHGGICEKGQ